MYQVEIHEHGTVEVEGVYATRETAERVARMYRDESPAGVIVKVERVAGGK